MIIEISAKAGEGKTRTAINTALIDFKDDNKAVFISKDIDAIDWNEDISEKAGKEAAKNFMFGYAKTIDDAVMILPYVGHPPYDIIILDDYSNKELTEANILKILNSLSSSGKLIITRQLNTVL